MVRALVAVLFASISRACGLPTKVLPLGDSITFGCGDGCGHLGCADQCALVHNRCSSGYRKLLWHMLSPNAKTSEEWDFVGTQRNGPDDIDRDHEGHPGWKVEDVAKVSPGWLALKPDVIMLHLGTNNMGIGMQQAPAALKHMESFLNMTFASLPKTRLLLSTLIGAAVTYGGNQHAAYNAGLKQFAVDYIARGFTIEIVDMATESGLGDHCDKGKCCPGDIHPTAKGYDLMANVWYNHLTGKSIVVV